MPKTGGMARLSYVLITDTSTKSAQRELNPRLLHGKQVRYRYAMSACQTHRLSKNPSGAGGIRTHTRRIKSPLS